MGDQMIGEGGAAVGIIFLILTVLIGVGMWVTNRRKERNQRREWQRERE